MKLVKSLLLGSAAGLMAVAGAQAADLPSRKAAPADYVRICSAYGAGYFFLPGSSDTCLRISGQVRGETYIGQRYSRFDDSHGFRARARINLDARTQTGYGTLRTFIRAELNNQQGIYAIPGQGSSFVGATSRNGGAPGGTAQGTLAFVQFAGITAGRFTSFFDYYGNDAFWNFGGIAGTQGDSVNGLAYTATFGGGFSATIAAESRPDRERGLLASGTVPGYAGARFPDIVAALRVQQGWGTAQLMGLVRDVNIANTVAVGLGAPTLLGSKTGYAVGAGVMFNLPMLAAGSQLYFEGVYTKGAVNQLGLGSAVRIGTANVAVADYSFTTIGGNAARLAEGYSLMTALRHFWTPQIKQAIFAGYTNVSYGSQSGFGGVLPTLSSTTGLRSFNKFEIGTNLIWSPVAGLDIGVEVLYKSVDPRGRYTPVSTFSNLPAVVNSKGKDSGFEGRFRVQRDF